MNVIELLLLFLFFLAGQAGGYATVGIFNGSLGFACFLGVIYSALIFYVYNRFRPLFDPRCLSCGKPLRQFDTIEKNNEWILKCPCGEEYNLKDGKLLYLNQQF